MSKIAFPSFAAALVLSATAAAGAGRSTDIDPSVRPQDDFYQYADGGWLKTHPIPAAFSAWGAFYEVEDHNETALHGILERVAAHPRGRIEQQVGDFYASGMDTASIEAAGIGPLQPELDRIDSVRTAADVGAEIARLHRIGISAGFFIASEEDPGNSDMTIAGAGQGGLGLPDRDYYFRDDARSKEIRDRYVVHVSRMLELAGGSPAAVRAQADAVMKLETLLAKGSRTAADLRDPIANYHRLPLAEVEKLTPHFDWPAYLQGIGLNAPEAIDIGQPEFFQAMDPVIASTPVADWQAYFRWHLVHDNAPFLGKALVDENFAFFHKELTGTLELRDRWKRVLSTVDGGIGEDLGQLYVAENFPPEAKARILALVGNLRAALRERLRTLEWMDEPTRFKALAKLDALRVKVGYPDKWIDYSTLTIDRGSYVLNVLRSNEFNVRRDLAKVGKPTDRTEWGMTPPTVNAYYNPTGNEIVFPAGILQPPFFDFRADDCINYGGIGAVIGHEMTHGFDDSGRQFDGKGNLSDWWTPESAARFKERSAGIVRQFNGYVSIDKLHVNGELTQGENIADLGGVKIAYAALQKALREKPEGSVGGFTPEQRFFLSYASVWRTNQRPEAERVQVNTDPHSPARFRVNGPLSNLSEFAAAFGVPEGAPMRRPAADRVVIW